MMMLEGSPHMVAAPPRLAQKTSDRIIGMGSKRRICASSSVTVARNSTTVMLSMNMARNADMAMKHSSSGTTW